MKKISKLKLNQIAKVELDKRAMNSITGGANCCICGCYYANYGGSSDAGNSTANNSGGYFSPSGGTGNGSFG